jgi:tetratricopeptide (TPR) repeat protein
MAKRFTRKIEAGHDVPAPTARKMVSVPPLPPWLNRDWLWGLILVLAVILTYTPVWWAGFVWDDRGFVTANPCIVGPLGLKEIWTTSAADICPLTLTTVWVEHALWGLNPLPYHLVNVLLHAACAVSLWRVLLSLNIPGAWLGAALWALHPVQVESVAWITELKNTQSGLFFLLSILFFVKWLRTRGLDGGTSGGWNYGLILLFAALAMASKSSTVVLPVVLCLCAWWIEGNWQWRNLARIAPIFLMSIAAGCVSMWTQKQRLLKDLYPQEARSWLERPVVAGDAVWFYLGKLIWPHPLMTIYPRWHINTGQWFSYLPLLAVLVALFVSWFTRHSWFRVYFFVLVYFLVALFPVSGLMDFYFQRYSFVSDHFQYLAAIGPLALAAVALARLSDFFALSKIPWLRPSLGAGLLMIIGVWSWQRAGVYQSNETLWSDTLNKNTDCWMAHYSLANVLLQKGQIDEAMAQFQTVKRMKPVIAEAYYNCGNIFVRKGELDKAIAEFQKALEIRPNYADVYENLGDVFVQKGQVDKAMADFGEALKIKPDSAGIHNSLGVALAQKGRINEAMAQFQQALRLNPNDPGAQNNLAKAEATIRQQAQQKQ